jgi:hypothetical protein
VRWAVSKTDQQSPVSPTDGNLKVPISPLDVETGSEIISVNDISLPIEQQYINIATHKVSGNVTFTLFAEAQTWGVSAFK